MSEPRPDEERLPLSDLIVEIPDPERLAQSARTWQTMGINHLLGELRPSSNLFTVIAASADANPVGMNFPPGIQLVTQGEYSLAQREKSYWTRVEIAEVAKSLTRHGYHPAELNLGPLETSILVIHDRPGKANHFIDFGYPDPAIHLQLYLKLIGGAIGRLENMPTNSPLKINTHRFNAHLDQYPPLITLDTSHEGDFKRAADSFRRVTEVTLRAASDIKGLPLSGTLTLR